MTFDVSIHSEQEAFQITVFVVTKAINATPQLFERENEARFFKFSQRALIACTLEFKNTTTFQKIGISRKSGIELSILILLKSNFDCGCYLVRQTYGSNFMRFSEHVN